MTPKCLQTTMRWRDNEAERKDCREKLCIGKASIPEDSEAVQAA